MALPTINWKQIIATALITGLVTILTGTILAQIQKREPKLIYSVPSISPFEGTNQNFAIYSVLVSNSGSVGVRDIIGVVRVSSATLEDVRVIAPSALKYTKSIQGDTVQFEIPDLNPSESITVSILTTSTTELPARPELSIRATDVVAQEQNISESSDNSFLLSSLIPALIVAYAGIFGATVIYYWIRYKKLPSFSETGTQVQNGRHNAEQHYVLSYLCGIHGLNDDAREYMNRISETTYWAEADRFATQTIVDPTSDRSIHITKLLKDLIEYAAIEKTSMAIIHYNIARIALAKGNEQEAKEYLSKAKKVEPKIIEIRLKLEPDLAKLAV